MKPKTKPKKVIEESFDYMNVPVGIFKRSEKGFYRSTSLPLFEVFEQKVWDKAVVEFRKTKTRKQPKGDQELKKSIMAFQPSGDYGKGISRSIKNELATATNLVQLDFDSKSEKFSDALIKKLFDKYKWIAIAQRSCGGAGFYLLVHTPAAKNYANYFGALCDFFSDNEKLIVDRAVSSVNEIRFVSLSSEAHIRTNATQWTQEKKFVASTMERVLVPLNGKILPLPEELNDPTGAHYDDIISWAGKQNSNGVALDVALLGFDMNRISKNSSHYNKVELVQEAIERVYETYSDQHGVAVVTDLMLDGEVDLPALQFNDKDQLEKQVQLIINSTCKKYLFRTDVNSDSRNYTTYRFNGKHWELIPLDKLLEFLHACAHVSGMAPWRCETPTIKEMLRKHLHYKTFSGFSIPLNVFNVKNGVLIFENGTVRLEEHSDKWNFTYILDYEYDPTATKTKHFEKFINKVLPDEDTRRMLFDYIGSGFVSRDIKIEKTLILLGSGANGKSTIIDLTKSLFGNAVSTFSLERLTDQAETQKELHHIVNKVFGVCSEARLIKDVNLWKAIVSKEEMYARSLYINAYKTTNYGRLITCMNEMPRIDAVAGSMRRTLIIGMSAIIEEKDQDPMLNKKLEEDRPAILNLIIEGYKRVFKARAIVQSERSKTITKDTIDESDTIRDFLLTMNWFPITEPTEKNNNYTLEQKIQKHLQTLNLEGSVIFKTVKEMYIEYKKNARNQEETFSLSKRLFKDRLLDMSAERLGGIGIGKFYEKRIGTLTQVPIFVPASNDSHGSTHAAHDKPKSKKKINKVPF